MILPSIAWPRPTDDDPVDPKALTPRPAALRAPALTYGATLTRPIVPAESTGGRNLQALRYAGTLPIDQNAPNLRRYRAAREYLDAMATGPAEAGARQPYGPVAPVSPVFADAETIERPGFLAPRRPAVERTMMTPSAASATPASPAAPRSETASTAAEATPLFPATAADYQPGFFAPRRPTATSVGGRDLGYGETVGGVRTFSDGSAGVPRTMSDAQIAALANGDRVTVVPDGAIANLAPGVAYSTLTGGDTPALGTLRLPRPAAAASAEPLSEAGEAIGRARRAAVSDLAAVGSEDPRSPLGIAARNLRVRMAYSEPGTTRQTNAGAMERFATGAQQTGAASVDAAARLGLERLVQGGAAAREADSNATRLEEARLTRPRVPPREIALADGTLGLLGEDGTVRRAAGVDGAPVRPAPTRQTAPPEVYGKLLTELTTKFLGADPLSGMIADPKAKGGQRLPTPEEIRAAVANATRAAQDALGLGQGADAAASAPLYEDAAGNRARLVDGRFVPLE